jgi:hypothetical protein
MISFEGERRPSLRRRTDLIHGASLRSELAALNRNQGMSPGASVLKTIAFSAGRSNPSRRGIARTRYPQCNWTGFPGSVNVARPFNSRKTAGFKEVLCVRSVR